MFTPVDIAAIQACIRNPIDAAALAARRLAGVIGDAPSRYSKSPALWNAAFQLLGSGAAYIPFDVDATRLADLISALRNSERVLGVNVTVPHKSKVMEFLDDIDPAAARIQAVNTIVRTPDGRLVGYNTDGAGFVESILQPQPGHRKPFFKGLSTLNLVILGAGGSARAVAFHLADLLAGGELLVCNRTRANASTLAEDLRQYGANARAIPETELSRCAVNAGLIVNCTTKGQAGLRTRDRGRLISMEDYSALAPIDPVGNPEPERGRFERGDGRAAAMADIERNHQASLELAAALPKHVAFYDLIYAPEETVFLRHGRMTGHRTMNGKAMIICQAALGLVHHLCQRELEAQGNATTETYQRIIKVMYQAWDQSPEC
jgi:shikimate dehydrogenase